MESIYESNQVKKLLQNVIHKMLNFGQLITKSRTKLLSEKDTLELELKGLKRQRETRHTQFRTKTKQEKLIEINKALDRKFKNPFSIKNLKEKTDKMTMRSPPPGKSIENSFTSNANKKDKPDLNNLSRIYEESDEATGGENTASFSKQNEIDQQKLKQINAQIEGLDNNIQKHKRSKSKEKHKDFKMQSTQLPDPNKFAFPETSTEGHIYDVPKFTNHIDNPHYIQPQFTLAQAQQPRLFTLSQQWFSQ